VETCRETTLGQRTAKRTGGIFARLRRDPYDYELARVWARVCVEAERVGRRLEAGDAWIAATAVHRQIPLLVHDRDFKNLPISGLTVISFA
jgi:predicted nucleic acid-binding protein